VRPQPLIACTDVEASSRWYQQLLSARSEHGGPYYERLVVNGQLILQLHHFDVTHHHPPVGDRHLRPYGNGVLLWFEVDHFDGALARAEALRAETLMPKHRNPPSGSGGPNHWEVWLRDPDGYMVDDSPSDQARSGSKRGFRAPAAMAGELRDGDADCRLEGRERLKAMCRH